MAHISVAKKTRAPVSAAPVVSVYGRAAFSEDWAAEENLHCISVTLRAGMAESR